MPRPGLRERKKLQTRADIVSAAARLFSSQGFDDVTIPQIAAEAGVSVKTVFNYFGQKDDLAFADEDRICAAWVSCVRRRAIGTSPFDAVRSQLLDHLADPAAIDELLAFQRVVASSRVLVARQRLVWDRLETAITRVLADEPSPSSPRSPSTLRYAAAQMVDVLRVVSSEEMCRHLESLPGIDRPAAVREWMTEVVELADHGLAGRFARESGPGPASLLERRRADVDPGSIPPGGGGESAVSAESPRISALANALESADEGALERFWAEVATGSTPLVEPVTGPESADARIVTFVWRGSSGTDGVVVRVNKLHRPGDADSGRMRRLPGTDVWHLAYLLPADWRGSYQFVVDGDPTLRPDPLNPSCLAQPPGPDKSVVSLPDAPAQPYLAPRPGVARGTVSEHVVDTRSIPGSRRLWIYEPSDEHDRDEPLPVVVLFDGDVWAQSLPIAPTLDNLIDDGLLPPLLAVMVDAEGPATRSRELACRDDVVEMVVDELLPWAARHWNVTTDPGATVIAGQSLGGLSALYAAVERPDRIGAALVQSGSFWWRNGTHDGRGPEWLTSHVASRTGPLPRAFVEVGSDEGLNVASNRRLRDALEARGATVAYREYSGGHDRACWRGGIADGLIDLLGR